MNIPNHSHLYLHAIMQCEGLLSLMDELKETKYYRHDLKNRINLLIPELEKVVAAELESLWSKITDHKGITELFKDQENLMKEIICHYTNDFPILTEILKTFRENPEFVMNKLEINLVDRSYAVA